MANDTGCKPGTMVRYTGKDHKPFIGRVVTVGRANDRIRAVCQYRIVTTGHGARTRKLVDTGVIICVPVTDLIVWP